MRIDIGPVHIALIVDQAIFTYHILAPAQELVMFICSILFVHPWVLRSRLLLSVGLTLGVLKIVASEM